MKHSFLTESEEFIVERFAKGSLKSPSSSTASLVDLVSAINGASSLKTPLDPLRPEQQRLKELFSKKKQKLFILIDALGSFSLEHFPKNGFLASHYKEDLVTVFPSTTSTATTSIYTSSNPCEHGVLGWWMYLPDYNLPITVLPFIHRHDNTSLANYNLSIQDVIRKQPTWKSLQNLAFVTPRSINSSIYSKFTAGTENGQWLYGYDDLSESFQKMVSVYQDHPDVELTFTYLPQFDSLCHKVGTQDVRLIKLIEELDMRLSLLTEQLPSHIEIIITADHGQVNVERSNVEFILNDHSILNTLASPPTCEPRLPIFHVKPKQDKAFIELFARQYGSNWNLLSIDKTIELQLFGHNKIDDLVLRRAGQYLAVSKGLSGLAYKHPTDTPPDFMAYHGGLHPDEMTIPLIIR